MPRTKHRSKKNVELKSRPDKKRRFKVIVVLSLAIALAASTMLLTGARALISRATSNTSNSAQQVSPASLAASDPAKEYVYVGGRLVATEEPQAASCTISISPTSQSFTSSGGSSTANVTASAGCSWSATSNVFWISLAQGASGTGNGSFGYSVGLNSTNSCRSGTVSVGSATLLITQAGSVADSDCDGMPNSVEPGEGRNPNLKDNDIFTNARWFVMQQYRDILGREGDSGGITYWSNTVTSGSISRAGVVDYFLKTPEFDGSAGAVTRLYAAYFLRRPDYGGLQFWLGQYRAGASLDAISNFFAASQEFIDRYGQLNNHDFVVLVYNNVLGRQPDQGGLDFWTNQLDSGAMTRGQVMLAFSDSNEFKNLMFNKVYVEQAYMCMLRRSASDADFNFWVGQLGANPPAPTINLINTLLGLAEYHNRFLP